MNLALALALCGTSLGQQIQVSGTVTSLQGDPLAGVSVRVLGTDIRTSTDAAGRYSLTGAADGVLVLTSLGYRAVTLNIAGRTMLDVVLETAIAALDDIVVTGYTAQRRADITGAVASVDVPDISRQTTVSVLKRLAGRVSGVTVDASGPPGSRSTVQVQNRSEDS
jgi:hypothetical protein